MIEEAARDLEPVEVGVDSGREDTVSHYRRLLADDGHVVMNWEAYPPEHVEQICLVLGDCALLTFPGSEAFTLCR